jgi:hypothetical protein
VTQSATLIRSWSNALATTGVIMARRLVADGKSTGNGGGGTALALASSTGRGRRRIDKVYIE